MEQKPTFRRKVSKNEKIKQKLFKGKRGGKVESEGQEIKRLKTMLESGQVPEAKELTMFRDLPISGKTVLGLKESGYLRMTDVQKESIPLGLRGMDILGAAKTGSGKTLAFIVPVLEKLYLNLWTNLDGLGALIVTPTRELAYQIFETLRNVGRKHDFSAGLIIGGKDLKFERKRMDQMNIIICTPGRLLQHMDENPNFDSSNVQILVLDEADRCLDLGFEEQMNAIIDHLPKERQTLLFSATQTKSVKDLARLSLKSPVYVSVHEHSDTSTPSLLQQSYIVSPLENKLDFLWSFIKHHKKFKILVFFSSCKQVRFVHLLFCRMRPGLSLLALHGGMHQLKRMASYDDFCKKQHAVLFATDVAARGLDFPQIDWVVQLDCPEDANTYIHRAGRTARYNKGGESLLVLLPSEEDKMLENLAKKKIPIKKIQVDQKRQVSVTRKFEALLARDVNLKECAHRAFKAYMKSVFLMKDKGVFDVAKLDVDGFASSLGLAVAPRIRFLQKKGALSSTTKEADVLLRLEPQSESDIEVSDDLGDSQQPPKLSSGPQPSSSKKTLDFSLPEEGSEDEDNLDTLFKSKKPAELSLSDEDEGLVPQNPIESSKSKKPKSKAALAKKLLKKNILSNKKVLFTEDGETVPNIMRERRSMKAKDYENEDTSGIDIERVKEILKEEDQYDKQLFRERIRAKHREERIKKRLARKGAGKKDEEQEGVDKYGSEEEGPDLNWLPDPDKIYGSNKEADNDNNEESENEGMMDSSDSDNDEKWNNRRFQVVNSDSDDLSDEAEPIPHKKRKLIRDKGKSRDKDVMEAFALQLLSKS